LNEGALSVLRDWQEQRKESELVFPSADGGRMDNISTSWEHLVKAAEIKNFRFHDLRHDFASKLVMSGVDLNTVRELLGHADIKMTLRYAHLAPEKLATAVSKLDATN
jgi:integrase